MCDTIRVSLTEAQRLLLEEMAFTDFRSMYLDVIKLIRSPMDLDNKIIYNLYHSATSVYNLFVEGGFGSVAFAQSLEEFTEYFDEAVLNDLIEDEKMTCTMMCLTVKKYL